MKNSSKRWSGKPTASTPMAKMSLTALCGALGSMQMDMMRLVTPMSCIPASHRSPSGEPFMWALQSVN